MELDKRIKTITDIQSVTSILNNWDLNKKGYFTNRIVDFRNLKKCAYGKFAEYREHDNCFLCEDTFDRTFGSDWYAYFIPEDALKPEEPKEPEEIYRAFSLNEFSELYAIGDVVTFRLKDCEVIEQSMLIGFQSSHDEDIPGNGYVLIGNCRYGFMELFNNYELKHLDHWQSFGVIDEDKE